MAEVTSDAERTVRAHAEMWNDQDPSKIPDVVSESYVEYNPAAPEGEIRGRDGLAEWMDEITSAFPDFEAELLDVVADEETVVAEVAFRMTHEGEFDGIPPTGREITFRGMGKFRVEDGTVQELRNYFDTQTFFDQLGVAEAGATGRSSGSAPATTSEENEQLALDHFDRVWHQGEFDRDVLADDYRVHTNLGSHEEYTLEEFEAAIAESRAAIPDLRKEPEDVIATDDRVVIRYTMTGTQEGEFKGVPPTGEDVEIAGVGTYRIEDGKLAEAWYVADFLRAMTQLGVVEPPGE